ncbi:uncharacterized protein LOC126840580 [Adelges cooleyi]|uniref:uncharacterized protein LOC126840580 n=1 Tax=Adelges cooleyi TaxID=133065 RepID=UPI00217F3A66|nr:uncharacterized protein LOC126840580 [Adelges cooleyi]
MDKSCGCCGAVNIEKLEFTNLPRMSNVWKKWRNSYKLFAEQFPDQANVSHFLAHLDEKCMEIYDNFGFDSKFDLECVLYNFDNYFTLKTNSIYARYKFNSLKRKPTQDVVDFYSELDDLSIECNFYEEERRNMIRDKLIVDNMSDVELRTNLLQKPNLDLFETLEILKTKSKKPIIKKIPKIQESTSTHDMDKKQSKNSSSTDYVERKQYKKSPGTNDVDKNQNKSNIPRHPPRKFTAKEVKYLTDKTKKYKDLSTIDSSVYDRIIKDKRASFQDCSIEQIKRKIKSIRNNETKSLSAVFEDIKFQINPYLPVPNWKL